MGRFFPTDASAGTVLNPDGRVNSATPAQPGVALGGARTHALARRETEAARMFLTWHDTFTHARWVIMEKKRAAMAARGDSDKRAAGERHTKRSKMGAGRNFGHGFALQRMKPRLGVEDSPEPGGGCVGGNSHDPHWITDKTQYYRNPPAEATEHTRNETTDPIMTEWIKFVVDGNWVWAKIQQRGDHKAMSFTWLATDKQRTGQRPAAQQCPLASQQRQGFFP